MFHVKHYDVIVIGGGHAGVEAAAASARMGTPTLLISLTLSGVGVMSCNPAIGGLGKGHLVREIDALDGVMGRAGDRAGIQYRLLNRRKGAAVQGPRIQADRKLYRKAVQDLIANTENLDVFEGEVSDILRIAGRTTGVKLADGSEISCRAVVLTAGTFLNGIIHIGNERQSGGRMGDRPSVSLAHKLADMGFERGRLKTGTPPRLDGRTINWDVLETQAGDEDPVMLSFMSVSPYAKQISCGITHTNQQTHEIINANLHRSAMYGGHIEGVGPRYCPSIEDKVVRFADKDSHQIFLEPEGLDDPTIYPNGISTSLPIEVQDAYVRSIKGLENVSITQPGYAIEYDYFDPRGLHETLEVKSFPGVFFAGQINGTTGYEEAGAQGLVAGLNAALSVQGKEAAIFSRTNSYIGVMISDLVTRGVTEPYRMFTSRAEFRLFLRADNADQRLTPFGAQIGLVQENRKKTFDIKMSDIKRGRASLASVSLTSSEILDRGVIVAQDGRRRNGLEIMAMDGVALDMLDDIAPEFAAVPSAARTQISIDLLYEQYLDRQKNEVDILQREEALTIPADFTYLEIPGLSSELRAKLVSRMPDNIARAKLIEGMTPAALLLIISYIRRIQRKAG